MKVKRTVPSELLRMSREIASGMSYLAKRQFIHRVSVGVISNREVAGSIPDDHGHTRLSSLSQSQIPPDFSSILLGGYQQPVHAGVCGVMCVREKIE